MSMPASTCLRTTSSTAAAMCCSSAFGSTGTPSSLANIVRIRSGGRGKLPVCVVRNRSLLRFIDISVVAEDRFVPEIRHEGYAQLPSTTTLPTRRHKRYLPGTRQQIAVAVRLAATPPRLVAEQNHAVLPLVALSCVRLMVIALLSQLPLLS